MQTGSSVASRAPRPSSLADVLDLILDKGLVIDAYVRVSLAGIEVLTVDARVVVASVDTYLRFAEAVNRLDLVQTEEKGLPELFGGGGDDQSSEAGGSNGHVRSDGDRSGASRQRTSHASRSGGPGRGSGEHRRPSSIGKGDDGRKGNDGGFLDRMTERAKFAE